MIPKNLITMRHLGGHGRFGNQLFQYAFLQIYAAKHDLEVQVPPWVGHYLFGIQDEPLRYMLPNLAEHRPKGYEGPAEPPRGEEFCGKNFTGYAQFHTRWHRPYQSMLRKLYRPTGAVATRLMPAVRQLHLLGRTRIGLHFRRGDYGRGMFYYTPTSWCLDWLFENWSRFQAPVLFIATEDAEVVKDFRQYKPLLIEDLGVTLSAKPYPYFRYLDKDLKNPTPRGMDFYPEFYILSHCDILLISNSTFPFWAAMLDPILTECWRSDLPSQGFIRIDPWNADPLTYDRAEDYPQLQGIKADANPYW